MVPITQNIPYFVTPFSFWAVNCNKDSGAINATRCMTTKAFTVAVVLASLWYLSFLLRRFDFHPSIEDIFNSIYVIVILMLLKFYKEWQCYFGTSLPYFTDIVDDMPKFLYILVNFCRVSFLKLP